MLLIMTVTIWMIDDDDWYYVDVDVDAWYINHMIKDVKINTHAML